jgi:hypothetical protein
MTCGSRSDTRHRLKSIGWMLAAYVVFYVVDTLLSRECRQSNCDWTPGFGLLFVGVCVLTLTFQRDTQWTCEQGVLSVSITSLVERRTITIPAYDVKNIGIDPVKDRDGDDAFDVVVTLWSGDRHAFNLSSLSDAKSMQQRLTTKLGL